MDIHISQGGIGKNIAFTSILNKLTQKICVSSYWSDVFKYHPMVDTVYPDYGWGNDYNKIFFSKFEKVIYHEPYFGSFQKGDMHLIEAFHEKYNLPFDGLYHTVSFHDQEIQSYQDMQNQLGNFVLVQFTGSDVDFQRNINELGTRNLRLETAKEVVDILTHDYKLNVVEVNNGQKQFENTVIINNRNLSYRDYLNLMRFCKSFISIDSCLNHMSAFKENPKKGVCLWKSEDYSKLFAYPHNVNLYSEIPLQMKFSTQTIVDQLSTLL